MAGMTWNAREGGRIDELTGALNTLKTQMTVLEAAKADEI